MNDGAENVGDYLDFPSNILKDGGIRNLERRSIPTFTMRVFYYLHY